MNQALTLVSILFLSSTAIAQDQVKVGDLIDLEERVLYKKMADELSKPNPNAPPPAPVIVRRKPQKVIHRTETLAVYGTSATFYEGQLSMGGQVYTVRNGMPVQDYVVSAITPSGITLVKRGDGKSRAGANHTVFAPLVTQ